MVIQSALMTINFRKKDFRQKKKTIMFGCKLCSSKELSKTVNLI